MEKEVNENVKENVKENVSNNTTANSKNVNNTEKGKNNSSIFVIIVILVLAIAGVAGFIVLNMLNSPEQLVKKYVEAMNEGNVDKMLEIYDVKGAIAIEKCQNDTSKFNEEYKNVSDEDANTKKDSLKKQIEGAVSMLKLLGGLQMEIQNVEKPEDLGNGLSKVTANVKMKMGEQNENQPLKLLVYNGKLVGEAGE